MSVLQISRSGKRNSGDRYVLDLVIEGDEQKQLSVRDYLRVVRR